ncbi:MAG: hypothetical protein K1X72_16450 [Pyrinomonadaceae bacterium]|nr:hypothetical protein [Pyrinomonadaceae bacterium]
MADNFIQFKPKQMAKTTWDYLIKFTSFHEGTVTHMYHNFPLGSKYPDVSCGIGFLLPGENKSPSASTIKDWFKHFSNADGSPATEDQFKADWEEAFKVSRKTQPNGGIITEFKAVCKLTLNASIIKPKMVQLLASKLNTEVGRPPLKDVDFWKLPAVAQVAVASVCYGYSPTKMPNFCAALKARDFDTAATEIKLSNMSAIKNTDHSLLMKDAAYLYQYHQDDQGAMEYLPSSISNWMPISIQQGTLGWGGFSEQIMSE